MCHRDTLYRALLLFNLTDGRSIEETTVHHSLIWLGILPDLDSVQNIPPPAHTATLNETRGHTPIRGFLEK